ncbi:MAG TPA: LPXTG cell wall anchor domain-containing protein [Candidatus Limivivens intestinipullorum]|uniref:LPXTG cell wall anchor domain-containing protein n=1 Tax=Candidatus Limivivens intestinipullorum TaxID=2840858 RepID=A0A9D1EU59_9FIRM|nr:LPXTG cell wall anchor domain-containing protein [Candidatus Limivivens intestinipullorum]
MKKKLLGSVLAVAVLAVSSLGAFAAGSKTADVTPVGDNSGNYVVTQYEEEKMAELEAEVPDVAELVRQSNDDEITTEDVITRVLEMVEASIPEELETFRQELEGKTMLTQFVDLDTVGDVVLNEDGMYETTLSVPTLTEAATNVRILHYSTVRSLWEIVIPSDVNYEDKEITAAFEDLSPIVVLADVDETADVAEGTSPKTGVTSDWGLYMAGAVVLFGAAGAVYSRKRA